jgi:hypothetical protein
VFWVRRGRVSRNYRLFLHNRLFGFLDWITRDGEGFVSINFCGCVVDWCCVGWRWV